MAKMTVKIVGNQRRGMKVSERTLLFWTQIIKDRIEEIKNWEKIQDLTFWIYTLKARTNKTMQNTHFLKFRALLKIKFTEKNNIKWVDTASWGRTTDKSKYLSTGVRKHRWAQAQKDKQTGWKPCPVSQQSIAGQSRSHSTSEPKCSADAVSVACDLSVPWACAVSPKLAWSGRSLRRLAWTRLILPGLVQTWAAHVVSAHL